MGHGFHVPTDKELNEILIRHGCTQDPNQTKGGSSHKKWLTKDGKPFTTATDGRQITEAAAFHVLNEAGIDREVLRSAQGEKRFKKTRVTVTPEPIEAVAKVTPEAPPQKPRPPKPEFHGGNGRYISNDLSAEDRERIARENQERQRLQPLNPDRLEKPYDIKTPIWIGPDGHATSAPAPEKSTVRVLMPLPERATDIRTPPPAPLGGNYQNGGTAPSSITLVPLIEQQWEKALDAAAKAQVGNGGLGRLQSPTAPAIEDRKQREAEKARTHRPGRGR